MNGEAQYRQITERLDRIERLTLIAAKPVLDLTEAAQFTGLSIGHLYRLTSSKQIPHFKKSRKLYFEQTGAYGLAHGQQGTNRKGNRQPGGDIRRDGKE